MRERIKRWTIALAAIAMTTAMVLPACAATKPAQPAKAATKAAAKAQPKAAPQLTLEAVNNPALPTAAKGGAPSRSALLRAQILLDRANFSTGEIDAHAGSNLKKALVAYQRQRQLNPTGLLDAPTWEMLNQDTLPALVEYTIAPADVAGPFVKIPANMADKALLPAMGYASPIEWLGEKFHASPKLLRELNPKKDFGREGEVVVVPNVGLTALAKADKSARVVVSKSLSAVMLVDGANNVVAYFPASVGSEHDPLPIGNWKINGVSFDPKFHYNPKLFWDAEPGDQKATIPPGPNNPVGVAWIDLSKDHYGIHGTPEPGTIGKTQSHGCIRLTNWDAAKLARAVFPGMVAVLQE
jgi:lipoprotein-anchoring transpeptidase ErfK/SrfK